MDYLYRGCEVNDLQLACPLTDKITTTFGLIGKSEEVYTLPQDATLSVADTNDFMTTLDGSLSLGGTAFGAATNFTFELNNNMAAKYALMNSDAYANKIGMIAVTGQLAAYIEDDAIKSAFRSDADQAFSITMTDKESSGNSYTLAFPKARFTAIEADSFNSDDLGVQQVNYQALLDSTSGTEVTLTRAAA